MGHGDAQGVPVAEAIGRLNFQARAVQLLLPPPSARICRAWASGYCLRPSVRHHFSMQSTANAGVSAVWPTKTVAGIGPRVVDAVGDGAALGVGGKVVVVDQFGAAVPFGAGIAERPTSSFFLVSTLMTGVFSTAQRSRSSAMCWNWSRGSDARRRHASLTRSENPIFLRTRATVRAQMAVPSLPSSAATLAVVRRVHFRPLSGSPAVSVHQSFDVGVDFRRFFSSADARRRRAAPGRSRRRARRVAAGRRRPSTGRCRAVRRCAGRRPTRT